MLCLVRVCGFKHLQENSPVLRAAPVYNVKGLKPAVCLTCSPVGIEQRLCACAQACIQLAQVVLAGVEPVRYLYRQQYVGCVAAVVECQ